MHAQKAFGQCGVQLDENFVGEGCIGGHIAAAAADDDLAVGAYMGSLDDGIVELAVETVTHFLRLFVSEGNAVGILYTQL